MFLLYCTVSHIVFHMLCCTVLCFTVLYGTLLFREYLSDVSLICMTYSFVRAIQFASVNIVSRSIA